MTLKQAMGLREGEGVTAIVEDPHGGESRWSTEERRWIYEPVRVGQPVVFLRLIPKVTIVRNGPWTDGHDQMLFCRTQGGQRAWLNIHNAQRVKPDQKGSIA